ncbi:MAG TPA: ferredoxin [Synergistaceae bacterium]|jgi:carbon-monoxide dehydrogenase small subunit|nr:MAG: Purine hydroxylase delta subunit apoprotein [Synergistales bacterium 53_16]KUL03533.1 MAG: Purine hydroxylase delta subunit apoprotein [Synergistales bacterium 54_9]MDN5335463.1 aerobic carbon-monoxide dehydrogenase small subunit [Synergistales bacterium]HAA47282.1 ferredoxin [Synergistaceae bacterium]HAG22339.1 ferredoxin [Synergistaceae bacterium]
MPTKQPINVILNGKPVTLEVEPRTTLLRALREFGITSVKRGCEEGECGTCTVLLDGKLQKSCMVLAVEAEGKKIVTSEGLLGPDGELHPVQKAFVEEGAIQCGFCTPGMVLAAVDLLNRHPDPTDDQIKEGLSGNLCRCTGYVSIIRAVHKAAAMLKERR